MRESRRSLAIETAALLPVILFVVIVVPLLLAAPVAARSDRTPVVVCHRPGTPAEHTITVDDNAVPAHLAHGDYLGPCKVAPTGSIGDPITGTPGPTGYEPPAAFGTPPPTDTTTVAVTLTDGGWLSLSFMLAAGVAGLLVTLRRLRR